jgi:hypothetical protein
MKDTTYFKKFDKFIKNNEPVVGFFNKINCSANKTQIHPNSTSVQYLIFHPPPLVFLSQSSNVTF